MTGLLDCAVAGCAQKSQFVLGRRKRLVGGGPDWVVEAWLLQSQCEDCAGEPSGEQLIDIGDYKPDNNTEPTG